MQDNFNTYSLIEDYLNGNLGNEEKLAFEKQLESNPELQTLLDDYGLVDILIEENELVAVNTKLTQIHRGSILKKNIFKGLISLAIISTVAIAYFMFPRTEIAQEKIEIQKETSKSISILIEDPTPFKIMDSASEVELQSTILQSKVNAFIPEPIDSAVNVKKEKEEEIPEKTILTTNKTPDSISKQIPLNTVSAEGEKPDSNIKVPCNITLNKIDLLITNSCSEKSTGIIQFTKTNEEYVYSINNKASYSSNPNFTSLRDGNYRVSLKNKNNNCESEPIEIIIEGFKCNYVIHPEQFIYLEKSLDKFQDENSVEVFIFNRNGGLVYNKTISTSEKFYWEGKSNTNLPTPMGSYTYLIKSGKKLSKGEITIIKEGGAKETFKTNGGIVEVLNNKVIVLAE